MVVVAVDRGRPWALLGFGGLWAVSGRVVAVIKSVSVADDDGHVTTRHNAVPASRTSSTTSWAFSPWWRHVVGVRSHCETDGAGCWRDRRQVMAGQRRTSSFAGPNKYRIRPHPTPALGISGGECSSGTVRRG
ncbi:hypothetical protein ACU4GG_40815 [Streptomyces nojiriensis]